MEYFQTAVIGIPAAALEGQRNAPSWPWLEAISPTLAYDQAICGDQALSADALARVSVPVFALSGDTSFPALIAAAKTAAAMIPGGTWLSVAGQGHELSPDALAPVLRELLTRNHP